MPAEIASVRLDPGPFRLVLGHLVEHPDGAGGGHQSDGTSGAFGGGLGISELAEVVDKLNSAVGPLSDPAPGFGDGVDGAVVVL